MNRLTFKESDGTFGVVGMNSDNQETKLYMCIKKLQDYEQTELSPDDVYNLKEENEELKKQINNLIPNTFNTRLRNLRRQKNITQEELASYLQVNRTTIVKWEKGTSEPTLSHLRFLSNYFKINLDDLIGEK